MFKDFRSRHAATRLRHGFKLVAVFAAGAIAGACQSADQRPAVSLEEAKAIVSDFEREQAFPLPPRTIADVVTTLKQMSGSTAVNEALIGTADRPISGTGTRQERALEYLHRARIARLLGRYQQVLEDAPRAIELVPENSREWIRANLELAAAYEELGDYYRAAELLVRRRSRGSDPAIIWDSVMATMLANIGDFDGANVALSRVAPHIPETYRRERGTKWAPIARSLFFIAQGNVALLRGDLAAAEKNYRQARPTSEERLDIYSQGLSPDRPDEAWRILGETYGLRVLAQTLVRQNRLAEAEALARDAVLLQARHFGRYSGQTAEGLDSLTDVLLEQGRFTDAATIAALSLEVYDRMGAVSGSITKAATRKRMADAHVGEGRYREAAEEYDAVVAELAADPAGLQRLLRSNLTWAVASIREGRMREAATRLRAVRDELALLIGEDRYEAAEAAGLLAAALAASGDEEGAFRGFSNALPTLLSRSKRSDTEDSTGTARELRLRFVLESYIDLIVRRG